MTHPLNLVTQASESQVPDYVKYIAGLVTGGLGGAALAEWFRRRRDKTKAIQLIERVNRPLTPGFRDITFARIVGTSEHQLLEEVKNLREYQFTLRNTSRVHLKDAVIQFEFPADDVQAWAERPTLSKTTLIEQDAKATAPWRKAFRWNIPHLPAGDSVEFTFRSVDPSSGEYETALYNTEGIILGRAIGEPLTEVAISAKMFFTIAVISVITAAITLGNAVSDWSQKREAEKQSDFMGDQVTTFDLVGCKIKVASFGEKGDNGLWKVGYRIDNVGDIPCVVLVKKIVPEEIKLDQGRGWYTNKLLTMPSPSAIEISISSSKNSSATTTVTAYVDPFPVFSSGGDHPPQ